MTVRHDLPGMPYNIALLPMDSRGYPVPWFVAYIDGKPDFRVADQKKMVLAIKQQLCWICGKRIQTEVNDPFVFVVGPMCALNRISGEPPSHYACAVFAAKACPFMAKPQMVRRENDFPSAARDGAGTMIKRNPGVSLLWATFRYTVEVHDKGYLFAMGDPQHVWCFTEGRESTREEILHSIETGLPILMEAANKEGKESVDQLLRAKEVALTLLKVA